MSAGRQSLSDREARALARREFENPLVLEAGAGTGKTSVLTARVLTYALTIGWAKFHRGNEPHERCAARVLRSLVAITFTEKAAQEMSQRIASGLDELRQGRDSVGWPRGELGLDDSELALRANALLDSFEHLRVETIHAFCRRVLSTHASEASLHPRFTIDADGQHQRVIVETTLRRLTRSTDDQRLQNDFRRLAARRIDPAALGETAVMLFAAGVRARDIPEDPYSKERVDAAKNRLADTIEALLTAGASDLMKGSGRIKASKAQVTELEFLGSSLERVISAEDLKDLVCGQDSDVSRFKKLHSWAIAEIGIEEGRIFGENLAEIIEIASSLDLILKQIAAMDPEVLPAACRVQSRTLQDAESEARRTGVVTFQDLLEETCALFRNHPRLTSEFRKEISQVLIDEFQDTDPLQYEIVDRLVLDAPKEERPGLFLVGDPKQSIYGWRGADLAAYQAFQDRLIGLGGRIENLTVNFRSVPEILDEVSRLISPSMIAEPGIQPEFIDLEPAPSAKPPRFPVGLPVEHWISWQMVRKVGAEDVGPATTSKIARELEAEAIARDLQRLRKEPGFRWSDAAILLRKTTSQEAYLEALREARIPFIVERDRSFYLRREVSDAISMVRTILDPLDRVALVGCLRSLWIGVPDAALEPLFEAGLASLLGKLVKPDEDLEREIGEVIDRVGQSLPDDVLGLSELRDFTLPLKEAVQTIARLRLLWIREGADVFFEALRTLLAGDLLESARYLGSFRLANLERLFAQMLELVAGQNGSTTRLLRELRLSLAEQRAEEEGRPFDEQIDAVRVLTIHKAKGLDFEVVYIPAIDSRSTNSSLDDEVIPARKSVTRRSELRLFGMPTLGLHAVVEQRRRVESAELVRLLYVASTRAKCRMVIAGKWPDLAKEAKARPSTIMDLTRKRRGGCYGSSLGADSKGLPEIDPEGVGWRVLGYVSETSFESPVVKEAPPLPTPRGLSKECEDARHRERLRFTMAVSAVAHDETAGADHQELPGGSEDPAISLEFESDRLVRLGDAREFKKALGTVLHRLLEALDLSANLASLDSWTRAEIPRLVDSGIGSIPVEEKAALTARAIELWQLAIENGSISRLLKLGPHVIGREIPLALRPEEGEPAIGALVGSLDLLYRDPDTSELVIADYKSDEHGPAARDKDHAYAIQGRLYQRAVQRALGLESPPRFEIWWLSRPLRGGAESGQAATG